MNLPDAGGIDPTGAIPLPIKGLETTGEQPLKRRSSVAKSTAELRTRRSMNRVGFIAVAVAVAAVASVAALFVYIQRFRAETAALTRAPSAPASLPAPAPPAPAAPAPAAQAQPAGQVAAGQAQPAAAGEPPPPPGAPAQQPAPQPPAASGAVAAAAPPPAAPASRRKARPEAAADRPRKRATRVAVAPPAAPAEEAPAPAEPPRKKPAGDPLLDFGGDAESDIEKELGAKKRSVYVPPAPGSDLPEKVSEAQINEGVASRMAALRECLSKQEAADPGSHGVLKVRWLIGPDGGVSGVKSLTPEFASQPIAACLTGVVKSIRFPRSHTTGQEVIFPFKF